MQHLKITRVNICRLILNDIYFSQKFLNDTTNFSLLNKHLYVIRFVRFCLIFKRHMYVMVTFIMFYAIWKHICMLFVVADMCSLRSPTTYLYVFCNLYVFCSTPWHISAPDTMSNLTVYNEISMLVILSPGIVMLQSFTVNPVNVPAWQAVLVLPHIITLSHYTVNYSLRQEMCEATLYSITYHSKSCLKA